MLGRAHLWHVGLVLVRPTTNDEGREREEQGGDEGSEGVNERKPCKCHFTIFTFAQLWSRDVTLAKIFLGKLRLFQSQPDLAAKGASIVYRMLMLVARFNGQELDGHEHSSPSQTRLSKNSFYSPLDYCSGWTLSLVSLPFVNNLVVLFTRCNIRRDPLIHLTSKTPIWCTLKLYFDRKVRHSK